MGACLLNSRCLSIASSLTGRQTLAVRSFRLSSLTSRVPSLLDQRYDVSNTGANGLKFNFVI